MGHRHISGRGALAARRTALRGAAALCALAAFPLQAMAGNISGAGTTYQASKLGNSVSPAFQGGTLQIDTANPSYSQNFTLDTSTTNTIDQTGNSATFSGVFSDGVSGNPGNLVIANSGTGGAITFTGVSTFTGSATINSGATLALTGTGSLATASQIFDGGTFDISGTTAGTSIISLGGAGTVNLGARTLTITNAVDSFSGVISGSGGLTVTGGTQILAGANTYTGGTNITGGVLQLATGGSILGDVAVNGTLSFAHSDDFAFSGTIAGSGGVTQAGPGTLTLAAVENYTGITDISGGTLTLASGASLANSSQVTADGTFDISSTTGTSVRSLGGAGIVNLGAQTLTITAGAGTFSGVIQGSGGVTVVGGVETLTGANTYTGATIVQAGTLRLGGSVVNNNISDSGTVSFFSGSTVAYGGVISGTGAMSQTGSGITTISAVQTYTGATTISAGTLALSGAGSIAASSGLSDGGTFDISAAAGGVSLQALTGNGTVQLGSQTLTLTNSSGTFSGNITGAGDLVLAAGKMTLSGTNGFTGTATISGGALYLASTSALSAASRVVDNAVLDVSGSTNAAGTQSTSINSLAGSGQVALGAVTLTIANGSDTFAGVIGGTGGITVSGGVETLTGANTYTGATTISGGTLALAGNGALYSGGTVSANGIFDISGLIGGSASIGSLAGSGTVNLGASNLTITNGADYFAGTITGTGSLTIQGGTQILAGANNYSGGTVIAAGTLQLGRGLTGGSITGDVLDNGTLAFDRADSFAFAGAISGTGALVQEGVGTTALTGTNSYSGGTQITSGTLQIGNGGTSGSITGNVLDNGTLAFDRTDAQSFSGTISGTGGVSVIGTGPLTLTANNSYSGAASIASGATLILTSGSIAASSDVTDNGTLDLSGASGPRLSSLGGSGQVLLGGNSLTLTNGADTFSGAIAGTGGLTLNGGAQTLGGVNSYGGATVINGGTLTVNGSIAASSGVAVNAGGTLRGGGTVSAVTVASGGTLAPGAGSSGTLTVNGPVTFASGSTFAVNLSSVSSPQLAVNGAASLSGTLSAASSDGTWLLGQKMTVLTATGGINGSFTAAPIASTGAVFTPVVSYDADDVYLTVNLSKLSPLLPANATANQMAPVAGIDAALAAGATVSQPIQALGSLTSAGLATAATQLAGEVGADLSAAAASQADPFLDAVFDRIQDRRAAGSGVWLSGFVGSRVENGDPALGSQKFSGHGSGFAGGYDWHLGSGGLAGVAISAGSGDFHLGGGLGTGSLTAYQAGVYGYLPFSRVTYGALALTAGLDTMHTLRNVTVSGTDTLYAKPKAFSLEARYETGVNFRWGSPYLAIQDRLFHLSGYGESAAAGSAAYALNYGSGSSNDLSAEMGLRQSMDVPLDPVWTLRLSDRLAWVHDMSGLDSADAALVGAPGSDFTVYGARTGHDAGRLSLGGMLMNRSGLGLDVHFESQTSGQSQSYTGIAGLNVTW